MDVLQIFQIVNTLFAGVFGIVIGSFLNVCIYRIPKKISIAKGNKGRSMCADCGKTLKWYDLFPLFSYLFLGGKCRYCNKHISIRYPIVEALSCVLSTVVAWHFGFSWACGAALLLTWTLLALAVIDFDTQLLPDDITLPLLWAGLLLSLLGLFTDIQSAVLGAVAG